MKKNKVLGIITLSLATLCVGGTFAAYTITDNANSIGAKITIDAPSKEEGYYLKWNDGEEIKLGDKVDTELKATVNVETTNQRMYMKTENKHWIDITDRFWRKIYDNK